MNSPNLSQPALSDNLYCFLKMLRRPLLRAYLDDTIVSASRIHHSSTFIDGQRKRLFHVDVLASLAGRDHRKRVPVIGSGNDDGINILQIKKPSEVVEEWSLFSIESETRISESAFYAAFIYVGESGDLDVGDSCKQAGIAVPLSTAAY
jgi:hypothetical protein